VALELNPAVANMDEALRFALCRPAPLKALFERTGLASIAVRAIEVPTVFRDFDDYWDPFLGRQGPAPTYLASLPAEAQDAIRDALRARLEAETDGSIRMTATAWAVQGTVPTAA
jgi:hypothetical protein